MNTTDSVSGVTVRLKPKHKLIVDEIMSQTQPRPTIQSLFEYLIEQEAKRRSIMPTNGADKKVKNVRS